VEVARLDRRRGPDQHVMAALDRLVREAAGKREPSVVRGSVDDIEIDLGHACPLLIRKSTSSGTGRPVAPFCASAFQATPAMSRWAHGVASTNFARNAAATLAPPSRLPEFAKSAKLLFSDSAYSSSTGRRHALSSERVDASSSALASASSFEKSPVWRCPRATTQAPVRVATSTRQRGSKRCLA